MKKEKEKERRFPPELLSNLLRNIQFSIRERETNLNIKGSPSTMVDNDGGNKGGKSRNETLILLSLFLRGAHMIDMDNIKLKTCLHAIILKKVFGQTMFNKY